MDGYQVLTIKKDIKPKDLGGYGKELDERKGTGEYYNEKHKFNYEFCPLVADTFKDSVYKKLSDNDIYYNKNKKDINILNGAVITSGQEFFKSLGMKFKDSGKVELNKNSKHYGEPIYVSDINSEEDIPQKVRDFFKDSYEYMESLVGKENMVYAAIHFDERTPHLQLYFLPVVNAVDRKQYLTDENGKRIMHEVVGKDGKKSMQPTLLRNNEGKIIYEHIEGKFLNHDQFWKDKGGKNSYAKLQDDFNEYITSKGYNLDRGNVGAHKEHTTKAEYKLKQLESQIELAEKELEINKQLNEIELKTNDDIQSNKKDIILSKDLFKHYKNEEVESLVNYTKDIKKQIIGSENTIKKQEINIKKLTTEVNNLRTGKVLFEANKTIKEQQKTINDQEQKISKLESTIEKLSNLCNKFLRIIGKAFKAVQYLLGKNKEQTNEMLQNDNEYFMFEKQLDSINSKYEKNREKTHDNLQL